MFSEEPVSLVKVRTAEQREDRLESVVEEAERKPLLQEQQEVVLLQSERNIDDDWFVLLDVPIREASYVPPGIYAHYRLFFCRFGLECLTIVFALFDISYRGKVCPSLSRRQRLSCGRDNINRVQGGG